MMGESLLAATTRPETTTRSRAVSSFVFLLHEQRMADLRNLNFSEAQRMRVALMHEIFRRFLNREKLNN